MGSNKIEYRASRLRAAAMLLAAGVVALLALGTFFVPDAPGADGTLARPGFAVFIGMLMICAILYFGQFFLRPLALVIGDDGIEAATISGWQRALWVDYTGTIRVRRTTMLCFRKGLGGDRRLISLPSQLIGLKHETIMAEVTARVARWHRLRNDAFAFSKAAVEAMDELREAGGPTGRRVVNSGG